MSSTNAQINTLKNLLDNAKRVLFTLSNLSEFNVPYNSTSGLLSGDNMFSSCTSLTTTKPFDTSNMNKMNNMFIGCTNLVNVADIDCQGVSFISGTPSNSQGLYAAFKNCSSLVIAPKFLNSENVRSFGEIFNGCTSLQTVQSFDASNLRSLGKAFRNCVNLINLPDLNTPLLSDVSEAFYNCSSLKVIPAWDFTNVVNNAAVPTTNTFYGCSSLEEVHIKNITQNFNFSASTQFTRDALNEIIGNLVDVGASRTLTIGATNLAKLTTDDIAVATAKGWTLA